MSGGFESIFSKGLTRSFGIEYDVVDRYCDRIFHLEDTDSRYFDEQGWIMPGLFQSRNPGEDIQTSPFFEDYSKRYIIVNYALGDSVAVEDMKDDLFGVIHRVLPGKGGALARSWASTREWIAANYFNNLAFSTASPVPKSPDGKPLYSTSHPTSRQNSATLANRPTTDADFSFAVYQASRSRLVQQKTPSGVDFMLNKPRALIVNPDQHEIAIQITQGQWKAGSANRDMNVAKDDNVEVIEWPFFTKSGATGTRNAWMLIGGMHQLTLVDRQGVEFESDYHLQSRSYLYIATARMEVGHSGWRGTEGSPGG